METPTATNSFSISNYFSLSNELTPFNLLVFMSPVILAIIVVGTSLAERSIKGFIYLGFLILIYFLRQGVYLMTGKFEPAVDNICNKISFSSYSNSSFSGFIFAFTLIYLLTPMISNNNMNIWLLIFLVLYFFTDMFTRKAFGCLQYADYAINLSVGAILGFGAVSLLAAIDNGKYLFFNDGSSSGEEKCSMPSKQNFKCQVYKDGELIGSL
jgi:hypothetical protein